MRTRRLPVSRPVRLSVEFLEDRTTPTGLAVPAAPPFVVVPDAPVDRVNVVTSLGTDNPVAVAGLGSAPFAAGVEHIGFGIYTVTLAPGTDVTAAVTYYSALPGVTAAEPDYVIQANVVPNDPRYSSLWAMPKISAPAAWDTSTGSGEFVVAVIDTGVDYNHPDLVANMWHNPADAIDGVDNDGNGIVDDYYGANFVPTTPTGNPMDDNNHGTHVAGTIGAVGNNGVGVAGVNWNVKIMALKFLSSSGSGSTSNAIKSLNYAVSHGVKVSNNSWGGGGYSTALFNAIQAAQNAGHIFVAAAGNNGSNNDTTPFYPASYNLANVVAVASTTSTDAKSSFSNYGVNTVDIAAPGSSILSTTRNNTYSTFSGTSMASPHVAGAIALYWNHDPSATPQQVIDRLKSSGDAVAGLTSYVPGGKRLNVAKFLATSPPPPPPADNTGPRVTAAAFSGPDTDTISSVRFTFNEAINPDSFDPSDVASFIGPAGSIAIDSVTAVAGSNNTQFDVAFAPQTAGGTYTMVIGPNILDTSGNPMDQDGDGFTGEGSEDQYTASRRLTGYTFDAGGLPLAIGDFQYTRATIKIDQDVTISDLNVRFSAAHTWDGDLIVRLIGPGGESSTLVNRRGGSRDNFASTVLDDEAGVAIASGSAPFTGTYRPETALSVFDGLNAAGTWTLEVYDASRRDTGNLTAFRLVITAADGGSGLMSVRSDDAEAVAEFDVVADEVDPAPVVVPAQPEPHAEPRVSVLLAPESEPGLVAFAADEYEPIVVAVTSQEPAAVVVGPAAPVYAAPPLLFVAPEANDPLEDNQLG